MKLPVARKLSNGLSTKSPKRDGCHGDRSRIGQNLTGKGFVRGIDEEETLIAVVWVALVGGIAALIIFPPDSVLTTQFRH